MRTRAQILILTLLVTLVACFDEDPTAPGLAPDGPSRVQALPEDLPDGPVPLPLPAGRTYGEVRGVAGPWMIGSAHGSGVPTLETVWYDGEIHSTPDEAGGPMIRLFGVSDEGLLFGRNGQGVLYTMRAGEAGSWRELMLPEGQEPWNPSGMTSNGAAWMITRSGTAEFATVWRDGEVVANQALPEDLEVSAVGADGVTVGRIWGPNGWLPQRIPGPTLSLTDQHEFTWATGRALALNAEGWVVGDVSNGSFLRWPAAWSPTGVLTVFQKPGFSEQAWFSAVADDGTVTGFSQTRLFLPGLFVGTLRGGVLLVLPGSQVAGLSIAPGVGTRIAGNFSGRVPWTWVNPLPLDVDDDGHVDDSDNCVWDPNPGQADGDGDGVGDACSYMAFPLHVLSNRHQISTLHLRSTGPFEGWRLTGNGEGWTRIVTAEPGDITGLAVSGDGAKVAYVVEGSAFLRVGGDPALPIGSSETVSMNAAGTRVALAGRPPADPAATDNDVLISIDEPGFNAPGSVPDGSRMVLTLRLPGSDESDPALSPDGRRVAFRSDMDGTPDLYVMQLDGTGLRRITADDAMEREPAWDSDGARLLFEREATGIPPQIWRADLEAGDGPVQITSGAGARTPAWSPDGTRIAYASRVQFEFAANVFHDQVFLAHTDGSGAIRLTRTQVSDDYPVWGAILDDNLPPIARDDGGTTDEDTAVLLDVLGNDGDPNGDALTAVVATDPAHGTLAVASDGTVEYTPAPDFHGEDVFTYEARDGEFAAAATVTITVRPVNDAPVPAAPLPLVLDENQTGTVDLSATDVDGDAVTFSLGDGVPAFCTLDGSSITCAPGFQDAGIHQGVVIASDGAAEGSAPFEVRVSNVNRTPAAAIAVRGERVEGGTLTFDGSGSSDPEDDALSYLWTFGDGAVLVGPVVSRSYGDDATESVTLEVSDGEWTASVTETVVVLNVAPVLEPLVDGVVTAGEGHSLAITISDPGADEWTGDVVWGDGAETAHVLAAGGAVLTHTYGAAGTYLVRVTVRDDDGGAAIVSAAVVVTEPVATVEGIRDEIDALVGAGLLRPNDARSLGSLLSAAARQYERGNPTAAGNQLRAFMNQVRAMVRSHRLESAAGEALIQAALSVIENAGAP